ncbi:uridylate kinase [Methylocella sp.]|uniref:amino acid kinase family protein n=1 Tax=Methylocella sp. TaxID=1978226 RepID=UPI0037834E6D
MNLIVAKIGGSLAAAPAREPWLDALAMAPACPGRGLVIVPGGGPFADAVRRAQEPLGFDDATAHRLALLAMHQYALVLRAAWPRLKPAASRAEIFATLASGRIPVWLPHAMASSDPTVEASWEMTSDSLSAWLARALGARDLLLVKSCGVAAGASLADLAAAGVVDPLFPRYAAASGARVYLAGPADLAGARARFSEAGTPGRLVARPAARAA